MAPHVKIRTDASVTGNLGESRAIERLHDRRLDGKRILRMWQRDGTAGIRWYSLMYAKFAGVLRT